MDRSPSEDKALQQLQARISAAQKASRPEGKQHSPAGHAMRMGIDLVSGTCVGTAVGYGIDQWLGSMPWFLLLGFCLGLAAGVRLMMQTARNVEAELTAEAQDAEVSKQDGSLRQERPKD
jgi:ATP synthase protein I